MKKGERNIRSSRAVRNFALFAALYGGLFPLMAWFDQHYSSGGGLWPTTFGWPGGGGLLSPSERASSRQWYVTITDGVLGSQAFLWSVEWQELNEALLFLEESDITLSTSDQNNRLPPWCKAIINAEVRDRTSVPDVVMIRSWGFPFRSIVLIRRQIGMRLDETHDTKWGALAANTAVMTGVGFTMLVMTLGVMRRSIAAARSSRGRRRLSRGECPLCSYPLDAHEGCPECGWNRREEGTEGQRDEGTKASAL